MAPVTLIATVAARVDEVFMKIAVAPLEKRASMGAPGVMVAMLSRFPTRSVNTTIGTGPEFVPRTTKSPDCPPPSRNDLPGSMDVLLVRDAQAAMIGPSARRTRTREGTGIAKAESGETATGILEHTQR